MKIALITGDCPMLGGCTRSGQALHSNCAGQAQGPAPTMTIIPWAVPVIVGAIHAVPLLKDVLLCAAHLRISLGP